jgi:hypothetical protein
VFLPIELNQGTKEVVVAAREFFDELLAETRDQGRGAIGIVKEIILSADRLDVRVSRHDPVRVIAGNLRPRQWILTPDSAEELVDRAAPGKGRGVEQRRDEFGWNGRHGRGTSS